MSFERPSGEIIEPPAFFTDLGTIPKIFRIGRLFQPEALPAFALVHDWVVRMNNCRENRHDFLGSIRIQQETLKNLDGGPSTRSL
ncbi:hypothetical protein [uncultured Tateyamaria sp.]|uniref:hypothetical protein n=1 Tax=uncultured Tateyamaria sp. TaxID=455651 RepID=UPI00342A3D55